MAKGTVNKVILIGRLGADPELRHTPGGAAVANFNLATNRSFKAKGSEEWTDETEWHRVVAWSRLAEVAKEYARKGSRVYVEGRLQTRDWEDQNGQKRYMTEVIAIDLQLLDSRGDSMGGSGGGPASPSRIQEQEPPDVGADDVPF